MVDDDRSKKLLREKFGQGLPDYPCDEVSLCGGYHLIKDESLPIYLFSLFLSVSLYPT